MAGMERAEITLSSSWAKLSIAESKFNAMKRLVNIHDYRASDTDAIIGAEHCY
jgi:hypothetical protein